MAEWTERMMRDPAIQVQIQQGRQYAVRKRVPFSEKKIQVLVTTPCEICLKPISPCRGSVQN